MIARDVRKQSEEASVGRLENPGCWSLVIIGIILALLVSTAASQRLVPSTVYYGIGRCFISDTYNHDVVNGVTDFTKAVRVANQSYMAFDRATGQSLAKAFYRWSLKSLIFIPGERAHAELEVVDFSPTRSGDFTTVLLCFVAATQVTCSVNNGQAVSVSYQFTNVVQLEVNDDSNRQTIGVLANGKLQFLMSYLSSPDTNFGDTYYTWTGYTGASVLGMTSCGNMYPFLLCTSDWMNQIKDLLIHNYTSTARSMLTDKQVGVIQATPTTRTAGCFGYNTTALLETDMCGIVLLFTYQNLTEIIRTRIQSDGLLSSLKRDIALLWPSGNFTCFAESASCPRLTVTCVLVNECGAIQSSFEVHPDPSLSDPITLDRVRTSRFFSSALNYTVTFNSSAFVSDTCDYAGVIWSQAGPCGVSQITRGLPISPIVDYPGRCALIARRCSRNGSIISYETIRASWDYGICSCRDVPMPCPNMTIRYTTEEVSFFLPGQYYGEIRFMNNLFMVFGFLSLRIPKVPYGITQYASLTTKAGTETFRLPNYGLPVVSYMMDVLNETVVITVMSNDPEPYILDCHFNGTWFRRNVTTPQARIIVAYPATVTRFACFNPLGGVMVSFDVGKSAAQGSLEQTLIGVALWFSSIITGFLAALTLILLIVLWLAQKLMHKVRQIHSRVHAESTTKGPKKLRPTPPKAPSPHHHAAQPKTRPISMRVRLGIKPKESQIKELVLAGRMGGI